MYDWIIQWTYDSIQDFLEDKRIIPGLAESTNSGIVQWAYEQFAVKVSISLEILSMDFCITSGPCQKEDTQRPAARSRRRRRRRRRRR